MTEEYHWKEENVVSILNSQWDTDGVMSCRVGFVDENNEDHNCDAMGCSSICHVLEWREATSEEKEYHKIVKNRELNLR